MRMVSYNILNGGEGRADPVAEVILAQRPDVVGLVEAGHAPVLERIAGRLEMDYVQAAGDGHAVALLSRFPIRDSVNHGPLRPGLGKALLEATVVGPGGEEWALGVVHLHHHAGEADERKREAEIEQVLEVFSPHREQRRPHVLMGDFNANAPDQQIDPAKLKPSSRQEWEANGGQIPRRVIERILSRGYVDIHAAVMGRAAASAGTFSTQHPGQRVDYVFAHGIEPKRLKAAWIETDRLAKYASDHFPVGVEIA